MGRDLWLSCLNALAKDIDSSQPAQSDWVDSFSIVLRHLTLSQTTKFKISPSWKQIKDDQKMQKLSRIR